jgi:P-type Cu+ transporter
VRGLGDGARPTSNLWRGAMARDPVCGMRVDEKKPAYSVFYRGTTYYFCTAACRVVFERNPERYIVKRGIYMTVGR